MPFWRQWGTLADNLNFKLNYRISEVLYGVETRSGQANEEVTQQIGQEMMKMCIWVSWG